MILRKGDTVQCAQEETVNTTMDIAELERRIRDFINSPRRQSTLLTKREGWNKLCSSLDLIGDTELAIAAYPSLCKTGGDGASYLIVYGILQTLLLQQDAAKHIADVLDINIKLPKELQQIRMIRNSAAGHPGRQKEKGVIKSCFISRISLSPVGFELMTAYSDDKDYEMTHVSIPKLLETQNTYLGELLEKVIKELEVQEMEHRNKHKDVKLSDCFPHTISYFFSKIFEASFGSSAFSLGAIHVKCVQDCLDNFQSKLEERGGWNVYGSVGYHYELIAYPMSELKTYFDNSPDTKINDKDVYIFASFVSEQIKTLEEIAKEIDEKYESQA